MSRDPRRDAPSGTQFLRTAIEAIVPESAMCLRAEEIAETICTTSAPARIALMPSFGVATPPVTASEQRQWPRKIAGHRRRNSSSALSDSCRRARPPDAGCRYRAAGTG
jgi:hypothetical protein